MKNVIKALNLAASKALNCDACSIDDKEIKRPSVVSELPKVSEKRISSALKSRVVSISLYYFPSKPDTPESELIDCMEKLSDQLDYPLDCGDYQLNIIDREFEFTVNKELVCTVQVEFDTNTFVYDETDNLDYMGALNYKED